MSTPIRRHPHLQDLSRDHHQGLLFAYHLRKGWKNGISANRILPYAQWFFQEHLLPHFEIEEKHLFPLLGMPHPLVGLALDQHRKLEDQLKSPQYDRIPEAAQLLKEHIRMEERELFETLEKQTEAQEWKRIAEAHQHLPACPAWPDPFWE